MSTLAQLYKRPSDTIRPEHLSHIIGDTNYSHVHFTDGSKAMFGKTLKTFNINYPYLIRTSKQLLVNPACITDWERVDSKTMWVEINGNRHWVARRRIDEVMDRLAETITKT